MAIKLNKTIKNQIVDAVVKSKFKPLYEKAERALCVAAREWAVRNSFHDEAMRCPTEFRTHISCDAYLRLETPIYFDTYVSVLLTGNEQRQKRTVDIDDPVYALKSRYIPDDLPARLELVKTVKDAFEFYKEVLNVVHSYTKAEKCSRICRGRKSFTLNKLALARVLWRKKPLTS